MSAAEGPETEGRRSPSCPATAAVRRTRRIDGNRISYGDGRQRQQPVRDARSGLLGETDFVTPGKAPCEAKYETFVTKNRSKKTKPPRNRRLQRNETAGSAREDLRRRIPRNHASARHLRGARSCRGGEGDLKWFRDKVQKVGDADVKGRPPRRTARSSSTRSRRAKATTCARPRRDPLDRTADRLADGCPRASERDRRGTGRFSTSSGRC